MDEVLLVMKLMCEYEFDELKECKLIFDFFGLYLRNGLENTEVKELCFEWVQCIHKTAQNIAPAGMPANILTILKVIEKVLEINGLINTKIIMKRWINALKCEEQMKRDLNNAMLSWLHAMFKNIINSQEKDDEKIVLQQKTDDIDSQICETMTLQENAISSQK